MNKFRESTMDKPGQCQLCGCEPDSIPLCEHLQPPQNIEGPREQKILFCPACPLHKHKWYQFKKRYQRIRASSTPMVNTTENEYRCRFCNYGYRA